MPLPKKGATNYHAQLGLPCKGCAIKGMVVAIVGVLLVSLYLLNGLATVQ